MQDNLGAAEREDAHNLREDPIETYHHPDARVPYIVNFERVFVRPVEELLFAAEGVGFTVDAAEAFRPDEDRAVVKGGAVSLGEAGAGEGAPRTTPGREAVHGEAARDRFRERLQLVAALELIPGREKFREYV
jgi:hypothetical protein